MPVEITRQDLERLGFADPLEQSEKKIAKRLEKEKIIRSYRASTGLFMLDQKPDGSCRFLGADRRCTVYEKRPNTCRSFPTQIGPRVGFCPYKRSAQAGNAPSR
jgi:Fe-S-cluster containining protein